MQRDDVEPTASRDWNFARLKRKLSTFALPENGNHQAKQDFIYSINMHLDALFAEIKASLFSQGYTSRNLPELFDEISAGYQRAFIMANDSAAIILELLAREYKRYVTEDVHNEERSYLPYEELLSDILHCCHGLRERPLNKRLINNEEYRKILGEEKEPFVQSIKNYFSENDILYTYTLMTGGYVNPFNQGFDPLVGTHNIEDEMFKVENDEGYCSGAVEEWAAEISNEGEARNVSLLDAFSYMRQKTQGSLPPKIDRTIYFELNKNVDTIAEKILSDLAPNCIYYLTLAAPVGKQGHATGIRRVPGTRMIEFYDPNYGLFLFKEAKAFINFFKLLLTLYYLDGQTVFLQAELFQIGRQNMKPSYADLPDNDDPKFSLHEHTTRLAYGQLLTRFEKIANKEEVDVPMFQLMLINSLLLRISYTDDIDVLERLAKKLPSAKDADPEKLVKFLKLLHQPIDADKYRHWPKIEAVQTAIQKRMDYLNEKQKNASKTLR